MSQERIGLDSWASRFPVYPIHPPKHRAGDWGTLAYCNGRQHDGGDSYVNVRAEKAYVRSPRFGNFAVCRNVVSFPWALCVFHGF